MLKEVKERELGADLPEPLYVFGQYMPKSKEEVSKEAPVSTEIDDSVLDDPLQLPITHEVEMKGHEGHVTALALGTLTKGVCLMVKIVVAVV